MIMLNVDVNVINDLADMTPGSHGFAAVQHFVNLIFRHFYATRARACAPPCMRGSVTEAL